MGTPKTIEKILEGRKQIIQQALDAPVPMRVSTVSDSKGGSTSGKPQAKSSESVGKKAKEKEKEKGKKGPPQRLSTLNAPKKAGKTLSVMCWNVQTFTTGKAETNPVVSFIVRQMLTKLDIDICIMLETRENPAVNLAAVESSTEVSEMPPQGDTGGDEEGDDEGDEADEPEELKARVEELASPPIDFLTLASEQTGKRFTPPHRIYPFVPRAKPGWSSRRFLKKYEGDEWKSKYPELCCYYAIYNQDDELITDANDVEDDGFELRLRRCKTCKRHYGSSLICETCRDFSNPGDDEALDRLRQSLEALTYGFAGRVEHETYAVLVRPSSVDWIAPDTTYLPDKDAELKPWRCQLLSKRVDDSLLGFQCKESSFYGRCPFLLALQVKPIGATQSVQLPIAAFHAPFGASNEAGFNARKGAVLEVLEAAVDNERFGDLPSAVLIGDLNLDATASGKTSQGKAFQAAVKKLEKEGFKQGIMDTKSSLTTVYNVQRKKAPRKRPNKYEGARWIDKTPEATSADEFTSSAYDNVFVKGDGMYWQAAVVDVIAWLADNIATFDLEEICKLSQEEFSGFDDLTNYQKAFFIYRAYVSDHLPIVLDIAVEPSNEEERAKVREEMKCKSEKGRLTGVDYEIVCREVLFADVLPHSRSFYCQLEKDGGYFAIGALHGVGSPDSAFVQADGEEWELSIPLLTARQLKEKNGDEDSSDEEDGDDLYSANVRKRAWVNGSWVAAYVWTSKSEVKDTQLQLLEPEALKTTTRFVFFTSSGEAILFGRITTVESEMMRVTVAETSMCVPLNNFKPQMKKRMKKGAYVVLVVLGYQLSAKQGE